MHDNTYSREAQSHQIQIFGKSAADFLRLIKQGKIKPGSSVILDGLPRTGLSVTLSLIKEMTDAGVDVTITSINTTLTKGIDG
jgi:hypothetical protein